MAVLNTTDSQARRAARNPQVLPVVWVCVFLALAVLAVFGQTARFGFVNFDDKEYVYENPVVARGLTLQGFAWAFTQSHAFNWHPLTWLSHMLDCQIYGLQPGGHHLTNVLLHAATVILLFLVLRQMTGCYWRSAFVAAVFAIHPLRAESVAWVAERKDVLSGLFFMLTIGAYVRYARHSWSLARYGGVMLLFALGLMAKPMLVTLPLVLLLLDYWPLRRMEPRKLSELVLEKLPLLALSAADGAATLAAQTKIIHLSGAFSWPHRLGNAVLSCVVYLGQMVYPTRLAVLYPYAPNGLPVWEVALAATLLAGLSVVSWAGRRNRPWLLVGWVWYLGMLAPVLGILQTGLQAHADRYTYLPEIGLAMAGTWAVTDLSLGWKHQRFVLGVLIMAAIGALAICGHVQTSYWKDDETLWTHTISCTTDNVKAHLSLAEFLRTHGRLDESIAQYRKALDIEPNNVETLNNLGNLLAMKGADHAARAQYQKALEIQPGLAETHVNLGNLVLRDNPDEAVAQYRQALECAPANAEILNNLGRALAMKGADDAAIAQYQKALEIQPNYANAHFNLGNRLLKQGKLDEAANHFRKAAEINPADADARNNLGRVLLLKGDTGGAMACFATTTSLGPDPLASWESLGNGFLQQELTEEAILCFRQAIKINPRSADACASLGTAFFKKGETNQAVDSWQQALAINPNQLSIQNNLAYVLATTSDLSLRNGPKALALATQANQWSGGGNPVILHTLAAAYAVEGSNGLAAATARRALALALEQKMDALALTVRKELKLYETNTPPQSAPQ